MRIVEEGSNWYITDRPCKRGHIGAKRSSYNGNCLECAREARALRLADPEFKKSRRMQQKVLLKSNLNLKERRAEYTRNWFKDNRQKQALYRSRRRTLTKDVWPDDLMELLLTEQNYTCPGCLKCIAKIYTVDHVVAVSLGGTNEHGNLQLLCRPCNSSKSNKSMSEWLITLLNGA